MCVCVCVFGARIRKRGTFSRHACECEESQVVLKSPSVLNLETGVPSASLTPSCDGRQQEERDRFQGAVRLHCAEIVGERLERAKVGT